ncbi:tetratricopeptide (TPR) repeat protein [Haloferula luteola]|uniref:Tetratricopeptide (TPR) repeat protein n=1 Tax=Haloferula luteola TaxID=595692 RepID=A0A840V5X4_9BACT|nr:hypothetical protein [Haloferula luteola]MBB5350188.1 tetratricopeptide (TPR) repeat protein [Haloferula luteola]
MKLSHLSLILLLGILADGAEEERAVPLDPAALVEDLGDESYPVRVTATQELWSMGKPVLPFLDEAMHSADPEVVARARDLQRKIRIGLQPDDDPEWIGWIEAYDSADLQEQRRIVAALSRKQAAVILLRLYEIETDPERIEMMSPLMRGVAINEARRRILTGEEDTDKIREILEMGRADPGQLMALADFHRVHGTLEAELKKARANRKKSGNLWRAYLQAAAGRPAEAAREAEAGGFSDSAARWKLLAGDPIPWVMSVPITELQIVPESFEAYRDAVRGLWEGENPPPNLIQGLTQDVSGDPGSESWHSVAVAYALGARQEADGALVQMSVDRAFNYLDSSERTDEALQVLGLDPDAPDFEGWVRPRFRRMLEDRDTADDLQQELKLMAGFMERRGLVQEAAALYGPLLDELSRKDEDWYLDVLTSMFSPDSRDRRDRLSEGVIESAARFVEQDPAREGRILDHLLGDGSLITDLWDELERTESGRPFLERLKLAEILVGNLPDVDKQGEGWWKRQIEDVPDAADPSDRLRGSLLLQLASYHPNARRFLEIDEQYTQAGISLQDIGDLPEDFNLASRRVECSKLLGDWKKVRDAYVERFSATPKGARPMVDLATAYRRVGQEEEAEVLERKLESILLGDSASMRIVGEIYSEEGDMQRAREWYFRAAMMSIDGGDEFIHSCHQLVSEEKTLQNWKVAASLEEFELLLIVMNGEAAYSNPAYLVTLRSSIELSRGMSKIAEGDRSGGLAHLRKWEKVVRDDEDLADFFDGAFREAGLVELHDEWFDFRWSRFQAVLERFPDSPNTLNTAAWVASRANRRLDEAESAVTRALKWEPGTSSYLDTLAEVWFARGDREQAIHWSSESLAMFEGPMVLFPEILRQNDRFRRGPLPPQ